MLYSCFYLQSECFLNLVQEASLCSQHWVMQKHKPGLSAENKWLLGAQSQGHLYQAPQAQGMAQNMRRQEYKSKRIGRSAVNRAWQRASKPSRSINTPAGSTNWTSRVTHTNVCMCVCVCVCEGDSWRTDPQIMGECQLRVDTVKKHWIHIWNCQRIDGEGRRNEWRNEHYSQQCHS